MDTFFHDVRYGFRVLLKSPGFTAVAVLTLALGIGANTAIFSVVDAVLLRPLPFPEPERLVSVRGVNPQRARVSSMSTRDVEEWQKVSRTIEQLGLWRNWSGCTLTDRGETVGLPGGLASGGLFPTLGVQPALGRLIGPEDDVPGHNQVVVLAYGLWQRRFGGDRGIIGRTLQIDEKPYTVIGVLPANFNTPSLGWMKIWAPHSIDPDLKQNWRRNRAVIARIRRGVSVQEARAELDTLAAQSAQQYPDTDAGWSVRVERLLDGEVGNARASLMLFLVAVGLVLLIACVNVINLLLTRVTARRNELAVRVALGASRVRIGRLLVTESLLICVLGGAAGLLLGSWALDGMLALAPDDVPRLDQVHLDGRAFAFAAIISIVTGVLLGIIPAWRARKPNLEQELKEGGFTRAGASHLRAGQVLASLEIALATVLFIGAALLGQSFLRLAAMPADFKADGLIMVQVFPSIKRYPLGETTPIAGYYQRVRDELKGIPGVQSVATGSAGPYFGGYEDDEFLPEGETAPASNTYPQAHFFNISPHYFETMGIPFRKGRDFSDADNTSAPMVVIVNEVLARREWPGQDPIGKRIRLVREKMDLQVVGVVGDVREWPAGEPTPQMYFPYSQQPRWAAYFLVRGNAATAALAQTMRRRIASVDESAVLANEASMQDTMALHLHDPKFRMTLIGLFAGLALALATVGVYGVVAYTTAQRTHEIGIRLALGAQRGRILRLVIARGVVMATAGALSGTIGALALARLLSGMLFGVKATDPLTLTFGALALVAVALMASYIPARRATRIDPLIALRYE